MPQKLALQGVRILDFSQMMLGPWATQFLGDYGADIIKVERPGAGEWERGLRAMGKLLRDGNSAFFAAMNRNKRSLALNLKSPDAIALLHEIVPQVDVVVENFRPGVMDKLGLSYEALSRLNPRLVYASGSGYGSSGPYVARPGQDLIMQGISGLAANTGKGDDIPIPLGSAVVDAATALMLALHIMIALFHQRMTGEGQKVEVALFNTAVALQCQELSAWLNLGLRWERSQAGIAQAWLAAPYGVYPTQDGYITIAMASLTLLADLLEIPALKAYDDPERAYTDRDEVYRLIAACTRRRPGAELLENLLAADIWCGLVYDFDDLVLDPQVQNNELLVEVGRPGGESLRLVGHPGRLSATPGSVRYLPPAVGEHTHEILAELGISASRIAELAAAGAIA